MNCEKCQELLSEFLDEAMSDADRASFNRHLEECLPCYNVHAELNSIVSFCREHRAEYEAPPNERALWLRIRNTVENEYARASTQTTVQPTRSESWVKHFWGRSWQLSFAQMMMAVIAIIVFASLATVLGLRGLKNSSQSATDLNSTGSQSFAMAGANNASKDFGVRDNVWQQQQIKFLTEVVEQRKAHWNPQVRVDFERNLDLLDETVNESLQRLAQHPHDDVTEEMLNAALNDKMQLLKEFSDL